jgi:type I restriction enzyme M protein
MNNFQEIANFVWSVADEVLRDDIKRGKYPDVILPFTVLRRLDCVLAPTKEKVLKRYEDLRTKGLENMEGQLRRAAGHSFYNISKFDFPKLLDDPKNIGKNLRAYISSFSENMRDVIDRFKLRGTIDTLDEKGLLFALVQKLADADLHPDKVDNHTMGTIFEELIRRFNEQSNENPGEHFTPREVIRLMVRLLINGDRAVLKQESAIRTVFDPAVRPGSERRDVCGLQVRPADQRRRPRRRQH